VKLIYENKITDNYSTTLLPDKEYYRSDKIAFSLQEPVRGIIEEIGVSLTDDLRDIYAIR